MAKLDLLAVLNNLILFLLSQHSGLIRIVQRLVSSLEFHILKLILNSLHLVLLSIISASDSSFEIDVFSYSDEVTRKDF